MEAARGEPCWPVLCTLSTAFTKLSIFGMSQISSGPHQGVVRNLEV
jgi:hypothetical protein